MRSADGTIAERRGEVVNNHGWLCMPYSLQDVEVTKRELNCWSRTPCPHFTCVTPLDVALFGPIKQKFRKYFHLRTITTTKEERNDVFTIFKLLKEACYACVNAQNLMAWFRRTETWSDETRSVDISKLRSNDLTSAVVSG